MKKRLQLSILDIAGIIVLLLLLVCVRIFQQKLFYDPLLAFFEMPRQISLPDYDAVKLFVGLAFRYFINSLLSIAILWLVFKDRQVVRLSAILLFIFFLILTVVLYIALNLAQPSMLIIFYVRRFLIQPLFLILFLPAFYYQKYLTK